MIAVKLPRPNLLLPQPRPIEVQAGLLLTGSLAMTLHLWVQSRHSHLEASMDLSRQLRR